MSSQNISHDEEESALRDDLNDHEQEMSHAERVLEGGSEEEMQLRRELAVEFEADEILTESELWERVETEIAAYLVGWQRHYDLLAMDHPFKQERLEQVSGGDVAGFYSDVEVRY